MFHGDLSNRKNNRQRQEMLNIWQQRKKIQYRKIAQKSMKMKKLITI